MKPASPKTFFRLSLYFKIPKLKDHPKPEWLRWTGELVVDVRTQRLFTVDRNSQGQLVRHWPSYYLPEWSKQGVILVSSSVLLLFI